jgi:hypothetical protein
MAKMVTTQRLAISGVSNRSTQLPTGSKVALSATADCTVRQGGSTVVAVADAANTFPLAKGQIIELSVDGASSAYFAVIGTTGSFCVATLDGA